jgi:hypothetical protein
MWAGARLAYINAKRMLRRSDNPCFSEKIMAHLLGESNFAEGISADT